MTRRSRLPSLSLVLSLILCPATGAADSLALTAVGDIMMGTTWPEEILPPQDGEGIFDNVAGCLRGADIVFGNLEGPLLDGGEGIKCDKNRNPKSLCFEFRTPARYVRHLAAAGFTAMNIANNHAFDFGLEGVEKTVDTLCEAGIQPVGGESVASFCIRGKRVAIAGFSYSPTSLYTYPLLDLPEAMAIVGGLKRDYDLVIVSFHGGAEGKDALWVSDADEFFAGEHRGNVLRFARAVIDNGADLVIGHGPHVPRGMELYKRKLIAYSLGNFLTYGRFNIQGASGTSLVLKVSIDMETGNFSGGTIFPVQLLERGIPFLDPEKKSIALIRELSAELQSEPGLVIAEDGALIPVSLPEPYPLGEEESPGMDQISSAGSSNGSRRPPMNRL